MAHVAPAAASGGGTPPRRAFGQSPSNNQLSAPGAPTYHTRQRRSGRPTSTASISSMLGTSPTPTSGAGGQSSSAFVLSHTPAASGSTGPSLAAPQPQRARAASAGTGGAAQAAAERAQQWLSALAPRGEGRGREFISNTLSGVANVASTVGQEVNGLIAARGAGGQPGSRPGSFAGSPPPGELPFAPRIQHIRRDSTQSPPVPAQSGNAGTAGAVARRPVALPANAARLGRESAPPEPTSPVGTTFQRSHEGDGLRHGPAPQPHRSASTQSAQIHRRGASHARTSSFGPTVVIAPPRSATSPAPSATSSASASVPASRRARTTPYKIGFQPAGVRSDRTQEYTVDRKNSAAEREKEEGRLGRRWAKLVDIHFNPAMQTAPGYQASSNSNNNSGGMTRSSSSSFSLSSIASSRPRLSVSMDGVVDSLRPKEVWKGLKAAAGPGPEEARKRAAEQRIVKWEEDADVKRCRICAANFNLSNRKHHCRLCGRIVCSLPPTPPALLAVQMQLFAPADPEAAADKSSPQGSRTQAALPPGTRREKCSLLLVADWRTGRGEEVDEGFVGWMSLDQDKDKEGANGPGAGIRANKGHARRRSNSVLSDSSSVISEEPQRTIPLPQQPQEVQVKGVRVCRECWATVSRKQKMAERMRVTPFAMLYSALREVQAEIDTLLTPFEAEITALQAASEDTEPSPNLLTHHRELMALLGQYDTLAKRASAAPCDPGGSQAKVQHALARSAAEFLAKVASVVQDLPRLQRRAAAAKTRNMIVVEQRLPDVLRAEGVRDDAAEDVARQLQPLLEQQAQLESFIAEANAQRKYDDSRSLSSALAEIENEIARLTASALK